MPVKICNPVANIAEFLDQVKELRSTWPPSDEPERQGDLETFWYRGQHSAEWGLSPKLHRQEYWGAQEAEIRQEFQSRALQLLQGRIPSEDKPWEWYFLMQHYRVPTRLLDWTDNPLVALYFAVNDQPKPEDAAVWVLDPWWLNRKLGKKIDGPLLPNWTEAQAYLWDLEKAFTLVPEIEASARLTAAIDPPHVDRRLAAQRSRFLIFGKSKDLTKSKAVKRKNCRFAKIVVPQDSVLEVQAELADIGLTAATIFPDLEHLGIEISQRWRKFKS